MNGSTTMEIATIGFVMILAGACLPAANVSPKASANASSKPTETAAPGRVHLAGDRLALSRQKRPGKAGKAETLFPKGKRGWAIVDKATMGQVDSFAVGYASYLAAAKTPRKAVAELVKMFGDGASRLEPGARPARAAGGRFWLIGAGGDMAAFAVLGKRPIEDGARIVVASVDAPRIELKQAPIRSKAGMLMLDTVLHGQVDLASWLAQPLALYLYAARPGAQDGAVDLVVGEAESDPILVIPDVLPHLSRRVQKKSIVDSAERMDAVAASSHAKWTRFLSKQGMDEQVLTHAEASLVPAGPARFVGVDRALLAGYGHSSRAFAYAAVRALANSKTSDHTAIVILVSREVTGDREASHMAFVKTALSQLSSALSERGEALDALETRRFYARSAALVSARFKGTPSLGLVLSPRSDDAVPRATRRVLDVLDAGKIQYQMHDERARGNARALSVLDMDAVDISIPTSGYGTPREVLSTLDLYQAHQACARWLTLK